MGGRSTCVLDNSKSQLTLSTMLNSKGIYQCISWIHFFHKGSYLSFKRIWPLPFSYKTSLFSVNRCIISPPCQNGGTCTSTGNSSYMCRCPEGFYGFNCEKGNAPCMTERKTRNEKPFVDRVAEMTFYWITIHLIPKWRRIDYSLACMLISPLFLVYKYKKQKNFEAKMGQRQLINMQTKE